MAKLLDSRIVKKIVDKVAKTNCSAETAAVALKQRDNFFFTVGKAASGDIKAQDIMNVINAAMSESEAKLCQEWTSGGPAMASDFLKSTRARYNAKVKMELEANLKAVCAVIHKECCDECRARLVARVLELGQQQADIEMDALGVYERPELEGAQ